MTLGLVLLIGIPLGLLLISYIMEALRRSPVPPQRLTWADIPIRYLDVDGSRIRYIVAGSGQPVVLLHTLRTQLDMFQKVVPELSRRFTVYALDYPGHGYSDIPPAEYSADFFVAAVDRFLEQLDIRDAILVGESIGGTIALVLAARGNRRVARVVAINPYDYDRGRGIRRSSLLANVILGLADIPVVGGTVMRLRMFPLIKKVFQGGVVRADSIPDPLLREMYRVGERKGHYQAFMSLIHHWPSWERARGEYGMIDRPVTLLYGERDWSRLEEREANARAIPGVRIQVAKDTGHFLSLENPQALIASL
jgi:pimeloyl-ACP methyl ester carboxylesterase